MVNERLRDAFLRHRLTPVAAAETLKVDPKTVERWVTQARIPYPKYRRLIASMVQEQESYLWPDAVTPDRAAEISESEVVRVYPRRASVPDDVWRRLLTDASHDIGVLVYGGLFLIEQNPRYIATLKEKASAGTRVRILLGDPQSPDVARRGAEEGIGDAMAAKVHNVLAFYRELAGVDGVGVNFHHTTLYNSIFRFDDEMLVNTHILGVPAHHAPVVHLRRLPHGDVFDNYLRSFDHVWTSSESVWTAQEEG